MYDKEKLIRSRLQDDLSRSLFEVRLRYAETQDYDAFTEALHPLVRDGYFVNYEMQDILVRNGTREVVLYGAGKTGRRNRAILSLAGMDVLAFVEDNPSGRESRFEGLPVVGPEALENDPFRRAVIVICCPSRALSVREKLLGSGISGQRIWVPSSSRGLVSINKPMQYFDVFAPSGEETFVDAGAYDGQNLLDFRTWTGGQYRKVFALEPLEEMEAVIRRKTEGMHGVEILPYAAWNREETLSFQVDGDSSAVTEEGGIQVCADRLDHLVREPVTFLKMDIEGSELPALEGARGLILRDRPRLAVCLYHKRWDILDIPAWILSLVPEYRFWIRHYSGTDLETVLFASVREEPVGMGVQKWRLPRAARLYQMMKAKRKTS